MRIHRRTAALALWAALAVAAATSACSSGAPGVEPSAAATDPCLLLRSDEVGQALGDTFRNVPASRNDLTDTMQCIYSTTTADPAGIVITSIAADGAASFEENRQRASSYYGGVVQDTEVEGADRAYLIIERDLKSPVIGMLIGDKFIELQVAVPGATREQGQELAGMIGARLT
jgi:hypothetical protein